MWRERTKFHRWSKEEDAMLIKNCGYLSDLRLTKCLNENFNFVFTIRHIRSRLKTLKLYNRPFVTKIGKNTRIEGLINIYDAHGGNGLCLRHCGSCNKSIKYSYLLHCFYDQELNDIENMFCLDCLKQIQTPTGDYKRGIHKLFLDKRIDMISSLILINKIKTMHL